jgi:SpoIID/LytB domain protein
MGQWGAFGYASEYGWGYKQILTHYYGGTTLGTLPSPEPDITVGLVEFDGHNTIASALSGGELVASWPDGTSVAAAAFEVARTAGAQAVLTSSSCAGPWRQVATTTEPVTIASAQGVTQGAGGTLLASSVAGSELQACAPGTGARIYQGDLVAQPDGQTQNLVALEDYVDGVVPAESPVSWASQGGEAALEAQAVAARSYALATVATSGVICDDTACQMYTGLPDQYGLTADAAVAATAGQVLYCGTSKACGPPGSVALTEYSASTGGFTAGGAFPPVPDLGDSVAANPVHTWTVEIPVGQVEVAFPSIGALQAIDVTQRNGLGQIGGRVEEMLVVGGAGSVNLTGDQFAADFSLRSDWFEVTAFANPPSSTTTTTAPTTSTNATTSTTRAPTTTSTTSPAPPASGPTTGTTSSPATTAPPGAGVELSPDDGYWVANSEGDVTAYGAAAFYGTAAGTTIEGKVTAMAATPDYKGYWLLGGNGGVLAFGDAHWYGSASHLHIAHRMVGMASTPDGRGYWLVSRDGGVFAYGDARFYGSAGGSRLDEAIVGIAPTPDGRGYWLVSRDGGVFGFGDARFFGSTGNMHLDRPITGIVPSPNGRGYFLVAKDGGVFAFGDAAFVGSLPSEGIRARVAAVAPTYNGDGYYVLTTTGAVYAFGDADLPRRLDPSGSTLTGEAVAIVCHRSAE